jgi:hypothetical protein
MVLLTYDVIYRRYKLQGTDSFASYNTIYLVRNTEGVKAWNCLKDRKGGYGTKNLKNSCLSSVVHFSVKIQEKCSRKKARP